MKRAIKREIILICGVILLSVALYFVPSVPPVAGGAGRTLPAKVLEVDDTGLTRHGLVLYGSQKLTVDVGGKTFTANNQLRGQMELDKVFKKGDMAVVVLQPGDTPQKSVLTAQDFYRNFWSFTLFGVFCILLCVFGGFTGIKALFSFIFSCLVIWKLVIPLALRGYPASWMIFISVVILTAVIIFLVAGLTRKGVAAFTGSISGVFAGLLMAHVSGRLMHISGAAMPYVQTLYYCGYDFLNIQDVFIGAMILACSGAVMDLAMDISSGIEELALHNPDLPGRELVKSGLRIGRSVVGTMTTTLLLAYSGGYITLLMMFSAQGTPVLEFLNSSLVASEVVKTLIGSFSLVLVAPFTALIAGWIFARKKNSDPEGV
ncbi:MAG: YibE/F family protein [Lentisphaeria bacterium]|nr:YibE/F family protein [Lentisphaeria bacterium]